MAYKYSRKNLPTISSAAGDAYTADPIGDLNRANEIAEKELRKSDITQRAEILKSVSGYGDTSYDQQFNDKTDALLLHYADEYAKVTDGLNRGTIDVGEGTAYKQQLMDKLDVYQKFVIASKTVEDVISKSEGIQKGGVGSLITGGGINDLEAAEMIHSLWNNPESLEIGGDADGRGMYLKNTKTGKVINMTEFNQMVGDGKSFLEEIPDFKTNTKTAMDAILANPNIGQFKYESTYTDANGSQSKRDMYDVNILKQEFTKADPWSAILASSTESNAAWEYLSEVNMDLGLEGEWYGNEMKTDGSGEYTDRALNQRNVLKDALTEYTINTNIPADQKGDKLAYDRERFGIKRSQSIKATQGPTDTGGLGNKNSADYSTLKGFNSKILELEKKKAERARTGSGSGILDTQIKEQKESAENFLKRKYSNRKIDGKFAENFKVEFVDPDDPAKGLQFMAYTSVAQFNNLKEVDENGKETGLVKKVPELDENGDQVFMLETILPNPVRIDDDNQLVTFENENVDQPDKINTNAAPPGWPTK